MYLRDYLLAAEPDLDLPTEPDLQLQKSQQKKIKHGIKQNKQIKSLHPVSYKMAGRVNC